MIEKILQKNIYDRLGAKGPDRTRVFVWIIWLLASTYLLEFKLSADPLSIFTGAWDNFTLGICFVAIVFYDKKFIVKKFYDSKKHVWILPFLINLALLGEVVFWGKIMLEAQSNYVYLVSEFSIAFYWILSIMLTVIYNLKYWILLAAALLVNCYLYAELLNIVAIKAGIHSIIYLGFAMFITALALIVSIIVVRYQLKRIFDLGYVGKAKNISNESALKK